MSCSTTTTERSRAIASRSSPVRSRSPAVMPATGSSTSSNSGSCTIAMPSSSHCFSPCARVPATPPRRSARPTMSSTSSMRRRAARPSRWKVAARKPLGTSAASAMFCCTVRLSNTDGAWNLRLMPRRAMASWSWASRSISLANWTRPSTGFTLPQITSSRVVLPAPLGPIRKRSSPLRTIRLTCSSALNPSNSTVTDSTYRIS